ncbi:MAG: IS66 family insertion sequence element accessory protein TnpB [Bacteroidetes bacterium]|nr:IS66 family insertion sequence element accessory protein TnpB [Bacteroidota bacterium]
MTGTGILFMPVAICVKDTIVLTVLVRNEFKKDPLGDVFIFLSRGRNKIKLLHWQGDGFAFFQAIGERDF